jgi:hypothetical protein
MYKRYCPLVGKPRGFIVILQVQFLVVYFTTFSVRQTIQQRFQSFFHGETHNNNFSYPEETLPMEIFTGHTKVAAGSAVLHYCHANAFVKSCCIS